MKPAADLPNWKAFAARLRNAAHKQQTASKSQMLMHERLRHWRNLQLLVRFFSIGCVFVILLVFFTPPIPAAGLRTDEVRVAAIAGTVLLAGALSHLMARYSVEASAFVYLCVITLLISVGDTPHEVAAGRTLVLFAVPILAAGAVLPAWAPFIFAALSTAAMALVGREQVAPLSYLVAGLTFFALAGMSWLSATSLERYNNALQAANLHLRQREKDFRLLFADNPLPMVLIDLHTFHVVEANQAAIAQSGYSRATILDFRADSFIHFTSSEIMETLASGATFHEERQHMAADGHAVHLAITANRVVYNGQPVALVIIQDITARRQAEEALRNLNVELEQRVEERTTELRQLNVALERSSRHKDEFLATMSHELRTPLTGILGSADVLAGGQAGPLTSRQERAVKLIQESGEHLLGLINSVLDLSKLEAGRLQIDIEPVLVRDVCLSALHMVQAQAKSKNQIVTFICTPDNFWVQADARRLKQILINLLGNAVKFTDENGSIRLEVRADFAEDTVCFCVTDNGIGIPADEVPHLFEPFHQVNRGLSRLYNGAGLGLPLVQRLTQLHGGSMTVNSTPGVGSCFTVQLPCRPEPLAPALSFAATKADLAIPNLADGRHHPPVVLLAEDHPGSVEVLRNILELAGCDLTIVGRGDEALELVKARQFDLVLMDVQMPGMDGLTATRAIRGLPTAVANTPIIALTAMALWGDRERCLEAGVDDYVSKPIDLQRLFDAMQQRLRLAPYSPPESATSPT